MKLNVVVSLHLWSTTSSPIYGKIEELEFEKGLFGDVWLFAGGLWSFTFGLL